KPAAARSAFDFAFIVATARAERLLAIQRTPGRPLCFRIDTQRRPIHYFHEQTRPTEPRRALPLKMGRVAVPFPSIDFEARRRRTKLGKAAQFRLQSPNFKVAGLAFLVPQHLFNPAKIFLGVYSYCVVRSFGD